MTDWTTWWQSIGTLNQFLYGFASFFSILFAWQLIGSLLGLMDVHDMDAAHPDTAGLDHADLAGGHDLSHADSSHGHDYTGHEPVADFQLLTVRSILAFFTLFFWAAALYLTNGTAPFWTFSYALLWGTVAMVSVAFAFYILQRMVESGTPNIATCVGTRGVVYLDIPANGQGEARVLVSGAVSCVKARAVNGLAITAGTPVRVTRALGSTTIEVEPSSETSPHTQGAI